MSVRAKATVQRSETRLAHVLRVGLAHQQPTAGNLVYPFEFPRDASELEEDDEQEDVIYHLMEEEFDSFEEEGEAELYGWARFKWVRQAYDDAKEKLPLKSKDDDAALLAAGQVFARMISTFDRTAFPPDRDTLNKDRDAYAKEFVTSMKEKRDEYREYYTRG